MLSLSERINTLKKDNKPFPLATFLTIYNKASYECYIEYMQGARLLHSWLTSDGKIPLHLPPPPASLRAGLIPDILISYPLMELVKIIADRKGKLDLEKESKVRQAILVELYKELFLCMC